MTPTMVSGPGTFQAVWLVEALHEGYPTSALIGQNHPPTEARLAQGFLCTVYKCTLYKISVQPYKCSKQSVCTPSLNENNVAGSIWAGSKNVRKEGAIIFKF